MMPANSNFASDVRASVKALCTDELTEELLREFQELNERFYLADFRPSELSGARFSEVVFRICQYICLGSYTPLGKTLPRTDLLLETLEKVQSSQQTDSFRIHIPRTLRLIYDFRSKRDVAHLGKGVSPNVADATLVLVCSSWILAEIVRLGHKCDISVAQAMVDDLVDRRTPLLWAEDDVVRVLDPALSYADKVLLLLHHFQPERVSDKKLFSWIEYSNFSAFQKNILRQLHADALIDYRDGKAVILPPGNVKIEKMIKKKLHR
jgi:hypothetical protein